jgi:hypothetical protein
MSGAEHQRELSSMVYIKKDHVLIEFSLPVHVAGWVTVRKKLDTVLVTLSSSSERRKGSEEQIAERASPEFHSCIAQKLLKDTRPVSATRSLACIHPVAPSQSRARALLS